MQVSGPPGDAFELVYKGVADRVRANLHAADAGLGEWIRQAHAVCARQQAVPTAQETRPAGFHQRCLPGHLP
jgi:hypothetical protein